jgi:hypothetical protein
MTAVTITVMLAVLLITFSLALVVLQSQSGVSSSLVSSSSLQGERAAEWVTVKAERGANWTEVTLLNRGTVPVLAVAILSLKSRGVEVISREPVYIPISENRVLRLNQRWENVAVLTERGNVFKEG